MLLTELVLPLCLPLYIYGLLGKEAAFFLICQLADSFSTKWEKTFSVMGWV